MDELLDLQGPLSQWVHQWAYLAVFLGIMLENAGIPVPGETIIVVASLMAGRHGLLRIDLIYLTVVAGAVIGDNLGYWVGLRGGRPLLHRMAKLWRISDARLEQIETNFLRHSGWAVFFGRFVALLRIFAGPVAGAMQMPWPRFFFFNATGAILWAGVIVGAAYVFGNNIVHILHNLGLTLLALIVIGIGLWALHHRQVGLPGALPGDDADARDLLDSEAAGPLPLSPPDTQD